MMDCLNAEETLESSKANQGQEEVVDLQAFQAKLEASLGNIQALVESWIPRELQQPHLNNPSSNSPTFHPYSSRTRNSRLGLGSSIEKQTQSGCKKETIIKNQLMMKNQRKKREEERVEGSVDQSCLNGEDEDSRTSTFNQKKENSSTTNSFSLLQDPPQKNYKPSLPVTSNLNKQDHPVNQLDSMTSNRTPQDTPSTSYPLNLIASNLGSLSKRQIKKLRKLERLRSFNN